MKVYEYTNNEAMEVISSFGIYMTIYDDGSYLLLFGKRKLQSFEL